MRLEKEYKKSGYFWLPGQEENRVSGTLTIEDGGAIELEIIGLFDNSFEAAFGDDFNLGRVNGFVEKDGEVTLEDCFYINKNASFGGISKSKICVNKVLSGKAYEKDEAVTFDAVSLYFDCLEEWVGTKAIDVNSDLSNKTATINYKMPDNFIIYSAEGIKLEICFGGNFPGSSLKEAKISHYCYFKIESTEVRPLEDFIKFAYQINNFICFAIDSIVCLKKVVGTSKEVVEEMDNHKNLRKPINIYYSSIPFTKAVPNIHWLQMLFPFGRIRGKSQDIFKNWFNLYEIMSPALDLYFSTRFDAHKYWDTKFLSLAQGLETLHRKTSSEILMGPEEYQILSNQLMECCPENNKLWLEGKLLYGNEISLRKRLKRLIEPFKDLLGTNDQRGRLIGSIVDTRNYLTHYSDSLSEAALTGRELYEVCLKMDVIFQLLLLNQLGLETDEIKAIVDNNQTIKRKLDITRK